VNLARNPGDLAIHLRRRGGGVHVLRHQRHLLVQVVDLVKHERETGLDFQGAIERGHRAGAHARTPQLDALVHREQGEDGEKPQRQPAANTHGLPKWSG
jgi:hypothetical protein